MKRPLKILCINQFFYPDNFGGVERVAHETMSRLAARGHDVHMVGQRTMPGTPDTARQSGFTVHRYGSASSLDRFGGRTFVALRESAPLIRKLMGEHDFDVLLPHHYFPYYAFLRSVPHGTAPEIMTFHASFWQELRLEGAERKVGKPIESLFFGGLARRSETACLRRADAVIVLSDFSREQVASYYPFAAGKVVKIPGGVDIERFRPADDRSAIRRALGLPEDRPVLFTARRLAPRMGVENLLLAIDGVRAYFPEVLLVIAGSGRLEGRLKQMVSEEGLSQNVVFAGFVEEDDLVRYHQAADLFVLPSLAFEGFGLVTLEALACGTPALGTPIGATPEILTALAPQLVLSGTEVHAIRRGIRAMLEWLSDDSAAARLRGLCRSYVEDNYGWEPAVDELERTIAGLLGEDPDG